MLYTKSAKKKATKKDGIRICIMRRPDEWIKYDLWIPQLSPSPELREQVKNGIGWEKFKIKFQREMKKQSKLLKFLANSAKQMDITLLCIEDDPNYCHRNLVAKEIKKQSRCLKIMIK